MDDKQSNKRKGLFGRSKPKDTAVPSKPPTSLLLILAGAAAQRLLTLHGRDSISDTQVKSIATGLARDLTTLATESGRQERWLRTKEARQRLMLGMALAGLLNMRDQLEAAVSRYTSLLMQTNPEMRAVTLDPAQSGVNALPVPQGQIVDSTLAQSAPPGGSGPLPRPDVGRGRMPAPTLSHLTDRELGAFANELREMFAAIIQAVQVVLGALGNVQSTGPAQIDSALAQTRALVTWLTGEERRLNTAYRIGTQATSN